MVNDSKDTVERVEKYITDGIAETSSVYAKGYSASNRVALHAKDGAFHKSTKAIFNDSNTVREVYHIQVSYDKPIEFTFDVRNAYMRRHDDNLEIVLPIQVLVIIYDFFKDRERLPDIILAGDLLLSGEDFLYIFAHTLYTWWHKEAKVRVQNYRPYEMDTVVAQGKNTKKQYFYESIRQNVENSPFWNSLIVTEEAPIQFHNAEIQKLQAEVKDIQGVLANLNASVSSPSLHTNTIGNDIHALQHTIATIRQYINVLQSSLFCSPSGIRFDYEKDARVISLEQKVDSLINMMHSLSNVVSLLQHSSGNYSQQSSPISSLTYEVEGLKRSLSALEHVCAPLFQQVRSSPLESAGYSNAQIAISPSYSAVQHAIQRVLSVIDSIQQQIANHKQSLPSECIALDNELLHVKHVVTNYQQNIDRLFNQQHSTTNDSFTEAQLQAVKEQFEHLNAVIDSVSQRVYSITNSQTIEEDSGTSVQHQEQGVTQHDNENIALSHKVDELLQESVNHHNNYRAIQEQIQTLYNELTALRDELASLGQNAHYRIEAIEEQISVLQHGSHTNLEHEYNEGVREEDSGHLPQEQEYQEAQPAIEDTHIKYDDEQHTIEETHHAIEPLQTWLQYAQGLPSEFAQSLSVVGVQYAGQDKVVDAPFETRYGIVCVASSGEVQYNPMHLLDYRPEYDYSEEVICTVKNPEGLYLSITMSLVISLYNDVPHAMMAPLTQYTYLHSDHGLSVDIQVRNPAIGDSLQNHAIRHGNYYYSVSTESHYSVQGVESIDESDEVIKQFYLHINPKATHHRYVFVHIYGYIAGMEYNNAQLYTIECREGVTEYPIVQTELNLPYEAVSEETVATHDTGHSESEHSTEPVFTNTEPMGEDNWDNAQGSHYEESREHKDAFFSESEEPEEYFQSLSYQEHEPYQDEYYGSEYPEASSNSSEVGEEYVMPSDAITVSTFTNDSLLDYARTHQVYVDRVLCNGVFYTVDELWLSRYGIVRVHRDGAIEYGLQDDVRYGLFYKDVYDVFTCFLRDEEDREIEVIIGFHLYSTQDGVVFSYVDANTIATEDFPAPQSLLLYGKLSTSVASDCILMIETYSKPYMYTHDMHMMKICVLSTMEEVRECIANIVLYIEDPESNLDNREVTIVVEGYEGDEYISRLDSYTITPSAGKHYYYSSDFTSQSQGGIEHVDSLEEGERSENHIISNAESDSPTDNFSSSNALYEDYANYDNEYEEHGTNISLYDASGYSNEQDNVVEEPWVHDDNSNMTFVSDSSDSVEHVQSYEQYNHDIPSEHIFTVEDALMCRRETSKDIRLSGISGDSVILVGQGWDVSDNPNRVYLQGCVYKTYGIHSAEGDYNVFIPDNVHVTYRA